MRTIAIVLESRSKCVQNERMLHLAADGNRLPIVAWDCHSPLSLASSPTTLPLGSRLLQACNLSFNLLQD